MWSFELKRNPYFTIRKYKSRFCSRVNVQKRFSSNTLNTYSPAVVWSTVNIMLIFSWILGINSKSIDLYNGFLNVEIPKGKYFCIVIQTDSTCVKVKDVVLNTNNRIYGQLEAPQLWYRNIKKGLESRGLKKSDANTCLFISNKFICIEYVEDFLFWNIPHSDIEEVIEWYEYDRPTYNWVFSTGGSVS